MQRRIFELVAFPGDRVSATFSYRLYDNSFKIYQWTVSLD